MISLRLPGLVHFTGTKMWLATSAIVTDKTLFIVSSSRFLYVLRGRETPVFRQQRLPS